MDILVINFSMWKTRVKKLLLIKIEGKMDN